MHPIRLNCGGVHDRLTHTPFFLGDAALVAGTLVVVPSAFANQPVPDKDELEVTPNEDLMREHGLLRRVLLIYDESINRLTQHSKGKPDFDSVIVRCCSQI